jgi:hypothetical protein
MIQEPDRTELALSVFDVAICSPHCNAIDALNNWCRMIAGLGGYLGCTAQSLESQMPPRAEHLEQFGFMIETAAKITGLLADHVESEIFRLKQEVQS